MASNPPVKRRHLYDTLRRLLARPLRQNEIETLKIALDDLGCPVEPPPLPETIGVEGIALIKQFEGCARRRGDGMFEAYPDPGTGGPPWTIGWGATRFGLHGEVTRETVWTQAQCDERLIDDLARYTQEVTRALGDASRTRNQFDALVSFHYNTGAIARATLTKKHIAGDYEGAAREFGRWVYAGGRVLKGLEHRRAAEAALYRGR